MHTKLSSLRTERNWTQDYVAEKLGLSQPAYSKLEKGQVKLTIDRAGKLAELYEIDPEYFFTSDAPIVNFNDSSHNETLMQNVHNYNGELQKEFYDILLAEKDKQIKDKEAQIVSLTNEISLIKEQLNDFIKRLADKV